LGLTNLVPGAVFEGYKSQELKLAIHRYLVPKFKTRGLITPLPICFVSHTQTQTHTHTA